MEKKRQPEPALAGACSGCLGYRKAVAFPFERIVSEFIIPLFEGK